VAFSSWQAGTNDIWLIDPSDDTTDSLYQLTNTPTADLYPAWHPQSDAVVFTRDTLGHRDVEALFEVVAGLSDPDSRPPSEELSWLGSLSYPRFSPDGETLAAVLRTHYGHRLVTLNLAEHAQPTYLTEVHLLRGSIDWHPTAIVSGEALLSLATDDASSLYEEVERPSISPNGEPHDLYRLNEVSTGSPWLSDLVDDSYRVMQRQLAAEVGYDFLGELSDMWRPMNFYSETSQYTSWHKSGRAFDTLFDWAGDAMKIVQEDVGGETYWRIFLRCSDQSGACGEPLTANPWNYSYRARVEISPETGGIERENVTGYYVDFTQFAETFGWERISSYDDEDYSWTWHFLAFEYWHYQKPYRNERGQIDWYQAMMEVYPAVEVAEYFNWERMISLDEDPYLIILKGVPGPIEADRWWYSLAPP
jgi:TolB protein